MCGSQYSSLLKMSENIKGKFEDSLDCLCVRGTSAPWSVAPRRVISAPHITAPTPRIYFCKKLQKGHICEIISRKRLNCKNYGRSPRSRAARSRPPGSGAAVVYSCKFPNRKYIFVKNENKKYKNKKTGLISRAGAWWLFGLRRLARGRPRRPAEVLCYRNARQRALGFHV